MNYKSYYFYSNVSHINFKIITDSLFVLLLVLTEYKWSLFATLTCLHCASIVVEKLIPILLHTVLACWLVYAQFYLRLWKFMWCLVTLWSKESDCILGSLQWFFHHWCLLVRHQILLIRFLFLKWKLLGYCFFVVANIRKVWIEFWTTLPFFTFLLLICKAIQIVHKVGCGLDQFLVLLVISFEILLTVILETSYDYIICEKD